MKHMLAFGGTVLGHDWAGKTLASGQPGQVVNLGKNLCTAPVECVVLFGTRDELIAEVTKLVDESLLAVASVESYRKGAEANASLASDMDYPLMKIV